MGKSYKILIDKKITKNLFFVYFKKVYIEITSNNDVAFFLSKDEITV